MQAAHFKLDANFLGDIFGAAHFCGVMAPRSTEIPARERSPSQGQWSWWCLLSRRSLASRRFCYEPRAVLCVGRLSRSSARGIRSASSAVYDRGSLSFEEALRIVDERGKAMQRCGGNRARRDVGGARAGCRTHSCGRRTACAADAGARVQLANFNSPTQIVISGDLDAVQAARSDARGRRETRRAAQRLGRMAQRADGAGGRTLCRARSNGDISACRSST